MAQIAMDFYLCIHNRFNILLTDEQNLNKSNLNHRKKHFQIQE